MFSSEWNYTGGLNRTSVLTSIAKTMRCFAPADRTANLFGFDPGNVQRYSRD
jgi:hypothetical protein